MQNCKEMIKGEGNEGDVRKGKEQGRGEREGE